LLHLLRFKHYAHTTQDFVAPKALNVHKFHIDSGITLGNWSIDGY